MGGSNVFMGRRKLGEKLSSHGQDGKENLNVDRRGFVKYAAAGIVAIGAAAAGATYHYGFTKPRPTTTTVLVVVVGRRRRSHLSLRFHQTAAHHHYEDR